MGAPGVGSLWRFIPACAGNARYATPGSSTCTVHPRMRGERYAEDQEWQPRDGSSPHARGTLLGVFRPLAGTRFIPACAGNAAGGSSPPPARLVHPRMRGERLAEADVPALVQELDDGSSPHARGTRREPERMEPVGRFIPACAGNAPGHPGPVPGVPVHPRMRGERRPASRIRVLVAGSSPHARGTLLPWAGWGKGRRFIPACAGNATAGVAAAGRTSVHPRMRGERIVRTEFMICGRGSSPHARGTRCRGRHRCLHGRFIPACAGNAGHHSASGSAAAVHPRMRGERSVLQEAPPAGDGSSPHARGTHRCPADGGQGFRFIPACAGNARAWPAFITRRPVHPRMRGERVGRACPPYRRYGSSPHARGTLSILSAHRRNGRFIPACAGNAIDVEACQMELEVHPRMRGERVCLLEGGQVLGRFIPACAGNASEAQPRRRRLTVHPRMRGERQPPVQLVVGDDGSSPHARGTQLRQLAPHHR